MLRLFRQGDSIKTGFIFALLFPLLLLLEFSLPVSVYADGGVVIDYYGEIGCSHCDTFIEKTVPLLEKEYGLSIRVNSFDILDPDIYEECGKILSEKGYDFLYFPVVIIGNNVYQGETEIKKSLGMELEYYRVNSAYQPRKTGPVSEKDIKNRALSSSGRLNSAVVVFTAGLADGINPCAFTVLLFFFSYLALRKKLYSDFLKAGAVFISAVFLTYIMIGFGFYTFLSKVVDLSGARTLVKIAVTLITVFFAAASFSDYLNLKKGSSCVRSSVFLKLPDNLSRRIHEAVRTGIKSTSSLAAVFAAGIIVSVLELACTGQVYLPSIIYMLQKGDLRFGLILLLIYNSGFVLPIISVYALLASGYRTERISSFFQMNIHVSKVFLAAVFVLLAAAVWFI